ncbi:hypothetical protein BDR22DRAFT_834765 [Usnea florida]
MVHCLLLLFAMAMLVYRIHAPDPCMKPPKLVMRYPKPLIPSPVLARMFPSYFIKSGFLLQVERAKAYSKLTNMVELNSWRMSRGKQ